MCTTVFSLNCVTLNITLIAAANKLLLQNVKAVEGSYKDKQKNHCTGFSFLLFLIEILSQFSFLLFLIKILSQFSSLVKT